MGDVEVHYPAPNSAAQAALRALTPAADRLPYFTSASAAALATLTSFIRTLLDDADAATALATLGASANPHGAADHSDITRSFFLKVGEGVIDGAAGAASTIGTQPFQLRVAGQRDTAALDGYLWTFQIPLDWASGALIAQPVWIPGSTDASAHAIRWSPVAGELAAGTDYTSAGGTYAFTGSAAARTANQIVYDTATAIFTPSAAGNLALMDYRRNGSDAADTYVGTSYLVGVIIIYTATQ